MVLSKKECVVVSSLFIAVSFVMGAERIKQNNADNLNLGSSWVGGSVPGWRDTAKWDSTVTSANSVSLGGDMDVLGVNVVSPGGDVTIGGVNALTVNYLGFDLSSASVGLTLTMQDLIVGYNSEQLWNVASGQVLAVNPSAFTRDGASVSIQGSGTVSSTTLVNDSTGIIGPWMRVGTGSSTKYVTKSGVNLVPYTGTAAATPASVTDTSGSVNYDLAEGGSFPGGASFNTIRCTGDWKTVSGDWSANGIMNAGSGSFVLSGNGTIGASRELVLTSPDTSRGVELDGSLGDNAAGASDVLVTGSGRVNLDADNTYSGKTYLNSGQLFVRSDGALGSTGSETIVSVNGSQSIGGQLVLDNVDISEPLLFVGYGDGNPWNSSMTAASGSGTNNLNGPITLDGGTFRFTAGGSGTVLNINAPITRINNGYSLIIGARGGTGIVNVNAPLDLNGGSIYTHSGPGFVNFNATGNDLGELRCQVDHDVSIGVSDAFESWVNLRIGGWSGTGGSQARGLFDLSGFNQTFNGFNGEGTDPYTTRVLTNSSANLSTLTSGNSGAGGTFNGVFSGNIAYVKNGSGTQYLTGETSYVGGTTVNGGILDLDTVAGHGPLAVNGGAFRFVSDLILNGSLSGDGGSIDTQSGNPVLTVNQDENTYFMGDIINSGSLVKNGSGTLAIYGDNTYSGGTTVNGGTLIFGNTNSVPDSGTITANPGSNLGMGVGGPDSFSSADVDQLWAGSHPVIVPPAGTLVALDTSAGDFTYPTSQTDNRGLIKTGPNMLRLSGSNSYSGGTYVVQGILAIPSTGSLPGWDTDGAYQVYPGAVLAVGNGVSESEVVTILATTNFNDGAFIGFDTDSGDRTYASDISNTTEGVLGLYKSNVDALYLNGTNSYDGNTIVAGGRVVINNNSALGSSNGFTRVHIVGGYVTSATGQLQLDGSNEDLVLDENFYINGTQQYSYGGAIRNVGGNNTINGWVRLESDARISVATGTLVINGVVERSTASLNPTLVSNPGWERAAIYSNRVDLGTGAILSHSSGTTVLAHDENQFGSMNIQYDSTIRADVDGAVCAGARVLLGTTDSGGRYGVFDLNGTDQTIRSIRHDGTADNRVLNGHPTEKSVLTIDMTPTLSDTYNGVIKDAISLIVDGDSGSVQTFGGTNTFAGSTTVRGATLKIGSAGTLGSGCTNVIVEGGTLELNNSSAISDEAVLSLVSGSDASVELAAGVNETVAYLLIDGDVKSAGTYGSTSSSAANKNDTYFSGSGVLTVRKDDGGCVIILR